MRGPSQQQKSESKQQTHFVSRRIRRQASNMAIDNDTLLTWSRIVANRQVQVTNELFPGGLTDLNDCTAEEVKDAVKNFRSHSTCQLIRPRSQCNSRCGSRTASDWDRSWNLMTEPLKLNLSR
jgi:hypothetical protein